MERFKKLVLFLAKNSECGNLEMDEEITKFENAIKKSGKGEAYFGIAKSNWEDIEVVRPESVPYRYKKEGVKYYAEYYDGMQAPFEVCRWHGDFPELEELLKSTSKTLYQAYLEEPDEEK